MADPFEESPWGDQTSLSNPNSSGASSIHHDNKNDHDDEADTKHESTQSTDHTIKDSEHGHTQEEEHEHAHDSSLTASFGGSIGDSKVSPERPRASSRTTPRRLNIRSRKTIIQPAFEEDASSDPLGPLGGNSGKNTTTGGGLASVGGIDDDVGDDEDGNISRKLASTNLSNDDNNNDDTSHGYSTLHGPDSILYKQQSLGTAGGGIGSPSSAPGSATLFQDVPLNYPSSVSSSVKDGNSAAADEPPLFQISVGDPIKVGDITTAHTVYTVHAKTTSPSFSKSEMSVTRRYRDFRWVFHALEQNNQGIIVPPPPDKQVIGKFNEDFVEQRRSALENMLKKIAAHPVLRNDPDFKLFLESDAFANDIKNRVMSSDEIADASSSSILSVGGSSGGSSSGGFMGTLGGAFSFSAKFIETSQWFIDKKNYLDSLESQLKSLAKALDLVVTQRRELSDVTGEFALVLDALADVEISKSLSELLISFSESQTRIQNLYSRQCQQDILSLSTTLDEYMRLISSVRSVFLQRQKSYFAAQSAEHELNKRRTHLEKVLRQGKTLQDKIAALQQEVDIQEKKVLNQRVAFDDISKRIMIEFDRLEHEKIHDFRNSVELFLENAVESQKEAIEVWETFYQRSFVNVASATASATS